MNGIVNSFSPSKRTVSECSDITIEVYKCYQTHKHIIPYNLFNYMSI